MTSDSKPLPPNRRRKWRNIVAALFCFYTVFGFLILPVIIKWQIGKQVPPLTHRAVSVEKVRVNPYALSLLIGGLKLTEADGADFASVGEVYVNFQLSSIFKRAFVFSEIRVGSPYANVILASNGVPNFANLIPPPGTNATPITSLKLPRVEVHRLLVTNGSVAFTDFTRTNPFTTRMEPIDLRLTNFTTRPNIDDPHTLTATMASGETITWSGKFGVQPLQASGRVAVTGVPLKKYTPYLDPYLKAQLDDGVVSVSAEYRASLSATATNATVTNATFDLTNLRFLSRGAGEELGTLGEFRVRGASADLATKSLRVESVVVANGTGLGRRYPAGSKQSTEVLHQETVQNLGELVVALNSKLGWSLRVDSVQATNLAVRFEDLTLSPPAKLAMTNFVLDVRDISNASNAPATFSSSHDTLPSGHIDVTGRAGLLPLFAEVKAETRDLDLRPAAPYAHLFAPVDLTSGRLSSTAKIFFNPTAGGPMLKAEVDVTIDDFATSESINATDLVKWKSLKVTGLTAELAPEKFHADEIAFDGLDTTVTVGKNGKLNLLELLAANQPASAPITNKTATVAKPTALPPVSLGTFRLTGASLRLQDRSLEPNALAEIRQLTGTVKGLTSSKDLRAVVDMSGRFDTAGPFRVAGEVQPLTPDWRDMFVNLTIGATNIDLGMASPYSGKFAGYPIQRGKVGSELSWHVERRAIKADNTVVVKNLSLGKRTGSTNATKLPVKLGIALLTDLDGKIELKVPVAGRLDDPKFGVGQVVWRVIENLLLKAATAPFALLGALFGGGGEELGYADFAPGSSELDATATGRLDKLAEALAKRPLLNLEITASVDRDSDRLALARTKLDAQIRAARVRELTASGKSVVALKDVKLEPADYERLLLKAYTNAFGPLTASTNPPTPMAGATNAPAKPASTRAAEAPAKGGQALISLQSKPPVFTPPAADMERRIAENLSVSAGELRELQQARAKQVLTFLLAKPGLTPERIYLMDDSAKRASAPPARRVMMTLN